MSNRAKNFVNTIKNCGPKYDSSFTITGVKDLPEWDGTNDHIQGLAFLHRGGPAGVASGSSGEGGWFATFDEKESAPREIKYVWKVPDRPKDYNHGGGVAILDTAASEPKFLAWPVESKKADDGDQARIYFFDITNLSSPRQKFVVYPGTSYGKPVKASAVAITDYVDYLGTHKVLFMNWEWARGEIHWYDCNYSDFKSARSNPFTKRNVYYVKSDLGHKEGTNVEDVEEGPFTSFVVENFSLVTDENGSIYLIAYRSDEKALVRRITQGNNGYEFLSDGTAPFTVNCSATSAQWKWGVSHRMIDGKIDIISSDRDPHDPSSSNLDAGFKLYRYRA
ncbi:MAG: hypothetical protein AAF614_01645 [Chloroflexota bacterium]